MWKAVLALLALVVLGHFSVRYLRSNPLGPTLDGDELVVETSEYVVRFSFEGPVEGTYLVARAESEDYGDEPVNASLSLVGLGSLRDYLRARPESHTYGPATEAQLDNLAQRVAIVAENRLAYGRLRDLVGRFEDRHEDQGAWLCVGVSGEAIGVSSAESLANGANATATVMKSTDSARLVLASQLRVEDCDDALAGR
jgi:hypothetical protein